MPQCVLTLSLIALSFDIYDNEKNQQSKELLNEDTALNRSPSLIEILSKIYFPPTFLIGPQIKFKHYLSFIQSNQNRLSKW